MKHFLTLLLVSILLISQPFPILAKEKTIDFSPATNTAIHDLAKDILTNGLNPSITTLKPQLDPQDYAVVKQIKILPDSPLYIFKRGWRQIRLLITFDQVGRTHQRLQNSNEKTLEAMLLIEKAGKEKDSKKHTRLISLSADTLDQVGIDFEKVEKNIEELKQKKSSQVASLQDETFRFAGQYLKHQILLQKQEDRLNSADFLTIESARVKHLESLAHIVVSSNRDPEVFAEQLVEIVSPQVGSNYSRLSVMALLRDMENNATKDDEKLLQTAQSILKKEVEAKLAKLPKKERLAQVERYSDFIHGNPIRQFQAYNLLSNSFTSKEMRLLTSSFKDKTAQNFKDHLKSLESEADRQLFVQALFSADPIDLRPLMYTEIQLQKKVLGVTTTIAQATAPVPTQIVEPNAVELERIKQLKLLLGSQMCQIYSQNPEALKQTRFYTQATANPTVLDIRVSQLLSQSIQECGSTTSEAKGIVADITTKIEQRYVVQAKQAPVTKLPTKTQAQEILQDEQIETSPQDERKVAEKVAEEIQEIENVVIVVEEEVATESGQITETITDIVETEQGIVEDILASDEPTEEEIIQKEEQIVEEIIDSAESGETSPLVEELPTEVQEEIIQETESATSSTPSPTSEPVVSEPTPTPTETTVVEEVIETVEPATEPVTSPDPVVTEPTLEPDSVPAL